MSIETDRLAIREARASGATVAALAREFAYPRHLVRVWTRDIEARDPREVRRQARANAWLRDLIMSHCDSAEFTLEQSGPATFEATGQFHRLYAGRLADVLGGVAELEGDTITINGCEVDVRLVACC